MSLKRTARYYKYGTTIKGKNNPSNAKRASKKKTNTDKKINKRKSQVKKRVEANAYRKSQKDKGKSVEGKDASHTKNGMKMTKSSNNRGKKGEGARKKKYQKGGQKSKKSTEGSKKESSKKTKKTIGKAPSGFKVPREKIPKSKRKLYDKIVRGNLSQKEIKMLQKEMRNNTRKLKKKKGKK